MLSSSGFCKGLAASVFVIFCLATPNSASAIDIVLHFDAEKSQVYIDPLTSAQIIPIFEAAAAYYEDVIEEDFTVTINFWWKPTNAPSASAVTTVGGRVIEANITIPIDINWYFDPSPLSDDGITMETKLYRDVPLAEQNEAFNGIPPGVLEVSYLGYGQFNGLDLLTVVMHEMGHALGLIKEAAGDINSGEVSDEDYDINPAYLGGTNAALEVFKTIIIFPNVVDWDFYHLALGGTQECLTCQSLMWPSQVTGAPRHRPSAADILAIASGSNWTDLDLQRKYWIGGIGEWNNGLYWVGGRGADLFDNPFEPDYVENVYLTSLQSPSLASLFSQDVAITNLTMENANDFVISNGRDMLVVDHINARDTGTEIIVNDLASEIETNTATFEFNSRLTVAKGLMQVLDLLWIKDPETRVQVEALGELTADTIFLTSSGQLRLLDGFVDVGLITLNSSSDISGRGVIDVQQSMSMGGWTIVENGILTFQSSNPSSDSVFHFNFGNVWVPLEGDQLVLEGNIDYNGGNFVGAGRIVQDGDAIVDINTTIGPLATYDWDGGGDSTTTVSNGAIFTLNIDKIEPGPFFDGFDGTLNLNGGTAVVNVPSSWALEGLIQINVLNGDNGALGGSLLQNHGNIHVAHTGNLQASIDTYSDGEIRTLHPGATAILSNTQGNHLFGGGILGPGIIQISAGSSLLGQGTIEMDVNAQGILRAQSGTLTVNGDFLSLGTVGTQGADSTLLVTHPWSTLTGTLDLVDGKVSSDEIANTGTTTGFGLLAIPNMNNSGLLAPGSSPAYPGSGIGTLHFDADYTQLSAGEMQIGITSTQNDRVNIDEKATLGGVLSVQLLNGFIPQCGKKFTIVKYGSLVSQFDSYEGLEIGFGLRFQVQYTNTSLDLVVVLQGDINQDGNVNGADLGALLGSWGPCAGCPADLNSDGFVNGADLGMLLGSWGVTGC